MNTALKRPIIGLMLVAATCLSLAGCASEDAQPAKLDVKALAAKSTPFQQRILEDGEVTSAEYESAVLAQRACVIEGGGNASEISKEGNNELGFTYSIEGSTDADRVAKEQATEKCIPEYVSEVGKVWAYQQMLSPKELDALRPKVAACLRSVGVNMTDSFTTKQLTDYLASNPSGIEAIKPCMEKFPQFFAVNPAEAKSDHGDE